MAARHQLTGAGNGATQAPEIYLELKNRHPGFFAAVDHVGEAVRKEGPLDEKMIQLTQRG